MVAWSRISADAARSTNDHKIPIKDPVTEPTHWISSTDCPFAGIAIVMLMKRHVALHHT